MPLCIVEQRQIMCSGDVCLVELAGLGVDGVCTDVPDVALPLSASGAISTDDA